MNCDCTFKGVKPWEPRGLLEKKRKDTKINVFIILMLWVKILLYFSMNWY